MATAERKLKVVEVDEGAVLILDKEEAGYLFDLLTAHVGGRLTHAPSRSGGFAQRWLRPESSGSTRTASGPATRRTPRSTSTRTKRGSDVLFDYERLVPVDRQACQVPNIGHNGGYRPFLGPYEAGQRRRVHAFMCVECGELLKVYK